MEKEKLRFKMLDMLKCKGYSSTSYCGRSLKKCVKFMLFSLDALSCVLSGNRQRNEHARMEATNCRVSTVVPPE